jgi:hypothetical protein
MIKCTSYAWYVRSHTRVGVCEDRPDLTRLPASYQTVMMQRRQLQLLKVPRVEHGV